MKKKPLKVLALFDSMEPTTIDHDLSAALKTEDRKTERAVLCALEKLGHCTQHLAIYDDLDLLRQKLQTFQPDVIFNLADQFRNNRALTRISLRCWPCRDCRLPDAGPRA
jgi:D-alanine-D-alanine ligase